MSLHRRSDTYPVYFSTENSSLNQPWFSRESLKKTEFIDGVQSISAITKDCHKGVSHSQFGLENKSTVLSQKLGNDRCDSLCVQENDLGVFSCMEDFFLQYKDLVSPDKRNDGDITTEYDSYSNISDQRKIPLSPEDRLRERISGIYTGLMNCSSETCKLGTQELSVNTRNNLKTGSIKKSKNGSYLRNSNLDDIVINQSTTKESVVQTLQYSSFGLVKMAHGQEEKEKGSSQSWHSQRNQFYLRPLPLPVARRISAQMWAIQIAEQKSCISGKMSFGQVVLLAKVFRIWYLKLRVNVLRKEEKKTNSARATQMYHHRLLCKSFVALRSFCQRRRKNRIKRYKAQEMALTKSSQKAQLKNIISRMRARQESRIKFYSFQTWAIAYRKRKEQSTPPILEKRDYGLRERKGEVSPARDGEGGILMSQVYVKWKQRHSKEQKDGIAALHFKIHLLLKIIGKWRLFLVEKRVKNRMKDVARIHIEHVLLKKVFSLWRNASVQILSAKKLISKGLLRRIFFQWKSRAVLLRILRQRYVTVIRKTHSHKLLAAGFQKWKRRTLLQMFRKKMELKKSRVVFMVWNLKYHKNALRRKLYRAQAREARKKRFFRLWMKYTKECKERRENFQRHMRNLILRNIVKRWHQETHRFTALRIREERYLLDRDLKVLTTFYSQWKFKLQVYRFRKSVLCSRKRRAVSKAADIWKGRIKEKKLSARLESRQSIFILMRLQAAFGNWKRHYWYCKRLYLRALAARSIIDKSKVARAFLAWQIVTQEDCIISPLRQRVQRRKLARAFDCWQFVVNRKTNCKTYKEARNKRIIKERFNYWRNKFLSRRKLRQESVQHKEDILKRCVTSWQKYVHIKTERRRTLAEKYSKIWYSNVQERFEARDIALGSKARSKVLTISFFVAWRNRTKDQIVWKTRYEKIADRLNEQYVLWSAFNKWKRQQNILSSIRNILHRKQKQTLITAFTGWRNFVRMELQESIIGFKDKLHDRSFSSGSNTLSTLRTVSENHYSSLSASKVYGSDPNLYSGGSVFYPQKLRSLAGHGKSGSLPKNFNREGYSNRTFSPHFGTESQRSYNRRAPQIIKSKGQIQADDQILMTPVIVPHRFSPTPPASLHSEEGFTIRKNLSSIGSQSPPEKPEVLKRTLPFLCSRKSLDDDTMLTSGIHSFSGYEEDESDDDTVSCASYQTLKEINNNCCRESFVSDTLRHWKFLPLSITFRAWLKHTQERRLHRELFSHSDSKKKQRMLQKFFSIWHREAYCSMVVEQYKRWRYLIKGLVALSDFAHYQKVKRSRELVAELHLRNVCLQCFFSKWKSKFVGKRKILHLVNRWQIAARLSDDQKEKTNIFILNNKKKLVANAFYVWKRMNENLRLADEFFEGRTLGKILQQWHVSAKRKGDNASKLRIHVIKTVLSKYFYTWKDHFFNCKAAEKHSQIIQRNLASRVIKYWNELVQKRKTLLSFRHQFETVSKKRLLVRCYCQWFEEKRRFQKAEALANDILLRRVFRSWQFYSDERINRETKMKCFTKAENFTLLQLNFQFWKRLTIAVQFQQRKQAEHDRKATFEIFMTWKLLVIELKAKHLIGRGKLAALFHLWKKESLQRKRTHRITRQAFDQWMAFAKGCRIRERMTVEYQREKDRNYLRSFYRKWFETAAASKLGRDISACKLARRAFANWQKAATKRRSIRASKSEFDKKMQYTKLSRYFFTWCMVYKRKQKTDQLLFNYLELKKQEMLQLCVFNFKKNAMKSKSEKFRQKRLLEMAFQKWSTNKHRTSQLRRIRKTLLQIKVREKVRAWRERTQVISNAKRRADNMYERRKEKLLRHTFDDWLTKARKQKTAKDKYEKEFLRRFVTKWRASVMKLVQIRELLQQRQQTQAMDQLSAAFYKWRIRVESKYEQRKLEEVRSVIAVEHHRKRTLEELFHAWRTEVLVEKLLRQRRNRLASYYFSHWRNCTLTDRYSRLLYEEKLCEKYWAFWRKYHIKIQVSRAMQDHDQKTLLSEVFTAWHNYAFLRKTLVKEGEVNRQRHYFRKWMQRYNTS